jgi:D-beta-D-heptose 7-phosphate kinase/D-beta-D-heptose 1-phosphate adenosyltransferase
VSTATLEAALSRLGRPHVLIVGDLILDRYVMGEVARISPEAPIPILLARRAELRLGGAGNVAANLIAMQAEVEVVGVLGDDGWGRQMVEMLAEIGVDGAGTVTDASRPTVRKTRHMSGPQQMLRVDWEDARAISDATADALVARLAERIPRAGAVVLSDYGKGVLAPRVTRAAIDAARKAGVPVLVDPKGDDYRRYAGATLITPNRKEAEQALGRKLELDGLAAAGAELLELADLDAVVITLGGDGIYHRRADGREGRVPTQARAVFDVTGAGDTVVAQLALYLADGFELEDAVALANHAAGITVGRLGTHAVTRAELAAQLSAELPHAGKILAPDDLERFVAGCRQEKRRIVFTNGCFDVLHVGHVDYLRFARTQGDLLIVGVNDDASVRRLKGEQRPYNTLADRMKVLAALETVDAVTSFSEDTPARIVERVTPDVLVKGQDWADKGVVGREWVESHGGRVVLAPLVDGKSTTSILERMRGPEHR